VICGLNPILHASYKMARPHEMEQPPSHSSDQGPVPAAGRCSNRSVARQGPVRRVPASAACHPVHESSARARTGDIFAGQATYAGFGNPVPARNVAGYERLGGPGDGRLIQGGVVIVLISDAGDRLAARSDVDVALGELLAGRQGVRRIALAGRKVA
jgi:hypothetical protein